MQVTVDSTQFIITCEVWENDRVKEAPERKWDGKTKTWLLPFTKPNAMWIVTECHASEIDTLAFDAANKIIIKINHNHQFPAWYRFKRDPRSHQKEALHKFYPLKENAGFMEMRTGKTKVAIDMAACRAMEGKINAVIVVVDSAYKVVWPDEFLKDCPIAYNLHVVEAGQYKAMSDFTVDTETEGLKVLVTATEGYSQGHLHKYVETFALSHKCMMIIDESESIKNHNSIRTEKITQIGGFCDYRMILTGTEITQGVEDLYSQFNFLNWSIIGMKNYYAFRARYCIMGGFKNKKIVSYRRVPQLLGLLEPYVYECKLEDVNDAPESIYESCMVEPTKEQKRMFDELGDPYMMATYQDDHVLEVETVLERMTRYQQIAAGIFPYDISDEEKMEQIRDWGKVKQKHKTTYIVGKNPKIDQLVDVIGKIHKNRKIIVWCRFIPEIAAVVERLKSEFGDESVAEYHGGNKDTRIDEYHAFQSKPEVRFFVTNKSGTRALELAAACLLSL